MISRSDADMYVVAIAIRPGSSTTTRRERFTLVTTPSTPCSGPVLTLTFCPSRILEETVSRYNASSAIMRLTFMKSSIALSGTIIGLRVALSHIYLAGQASPRPVIYASRASFSVLTKHRLDTAGTNVSNPSSSRALQNFLSRPYVTLIAYHFIAQR